MSIDNIRTYYSGGYYNLSQAEASYLNYDINTTVGSVSTEFFDIIDPSNAPRPTWSNKITVYTNSTGQTGSVPVNFEPSVENIANGDQQFLTVVNNAGIPLTGTVGTETITLNVNSAVNLVCIKKTIKDCEDVVEEYKQTNYSKIN